ncbi:MAG: hypothetical protein P8L85_15345 [Rubripirellula sp.]|nr:hypothetical protein [Rubripirellula sp.]
MAKCDEGYRCEVCRQDVTSIVDSDLYLRFVIGELDAEVLHTSPERHIRCNPVLAQFIRNEGFQPVSVQGSFDRAQLDPVFVAQRELLLSRGYARLLELAAIDEDYDLREYPLPEALAKVR